MQDNREAQSVEILIISFDGYSDIWNLSISSFFTYWPDCPYKINLLTNHKTYPDARIRSLCIGIDQDWSSNLLMGLEKLTSEYVLTIFEDLILTEHVSTTLVQEMISTCIENQYNYMRLRPSPPPDGKEYTTYGSINRGAPYRVSLCTSIVRRSTLQHLLRKGESAWDFEKYGSLRSQHFQQFYSTYEQIIPYMNSIEKGKWNPSMIDRLKDEGIDFQQRGLFQNEKKPNGLSQIKHCMVFRIMPVFIRQLFYAIRKKI
jgi:hypothetical protein